MRLMPLYKLAADLDRAGDDLDADHLRRMVRSRKAMAADVRSTGKVMPAGCPQRMVVRGVEVEVLEGQVLHFHMRYCEDAAPEPVAAEWAPRGFVVAHSRRLSRGRRALREFLAMFPPVDECVQAMRLRALVRQGD